METQIHDFINFLKYIEQLSTNTVDAYQRDLIQYKDYLEQQNLTFDNVTHVQLSQFLRDNEKNSSSIARMASSLRRFYLFLKVNRVVSADPTQFLKVKSSSHRLPKYITLSEFESLISFNLEKPEDYLDRALIEILYGSGLRATECIELKEDHYFPKERMLRVLGKGQKTRVVPLSRASIQALNDYFTNARSIWLTKSSSYLFINRKTQPLSRHYLYNMLKRRSQQAGLAKNVSPHILRHSFASELINHGADLRVIQELLGHSDVSTTQIYTHIDSQAKKKEYNNFHPGQYIKHKEEGEGEEK
ncbi:MAG: tyrosine recombinase [Erysipelothrix sp.]|nr:tyrosine recombinase [Erysipelothrix sp.]